MMTSPRSKWVLARRIGCACAIALGLLGVAVSHARPPSILPVSTDLASSNELMVSYRHQERMWQTADQAFHLVVNRGGLQPPGLVLYSSYDGGVTWAPTQVLSPTNKDSTADGFLQGTLLSIAYANTDGSIFFAQFSYDSGARTWTLVRNESVYSSTQFRGVNPAVAMDDTGAIWCSFSAFDRTTNDVNIRLTYRVGDNLPWADTGLIFGPTDHLSKERSARPIRIPGGMGMIYRVNQSTLWTARANGAPYDSAWPAALNINEGTPQRKVSDPYASHFSVIADDLDYLHLAVADDGNALYLRYTSSTGIWTAAEKLNGRIKISYLQLGLSNGQVALAFSASRGQGDVLVSNDHGSTFVQQATLELPAAAPGTSYATGRIETAGKSVGTLTVMQQYEDQNLQRLMVFKVPPP